MKFSNGGGNRIYLDKFDAKADLHGNWTDEQKRVLLAAPELLAMLEDVAEVANLCPADAKVVSELIARVKVEG